LGEDGEISWSRVDEKIDLQHTHHLSYPSSLPTSNMIDNLKNDKSTNKNQQQDQENEFYDDDQSHHHRTISQISPSHFDNTIPFEKVRK